MEIFVASSHDSYSSSTSLFGRCVERGLMTCGCRIGVISWQEYLIVGSESRILPRDLFTNKLIVVIQMYSQIESPFPSSRL